MHHDLDMMIFYPDGKPPESFHYRASSLSDKWSRFCRDMLDQGGPVFTQNLGGNLSHFDIQIAGPLGRLSVHSRACYDFWIIRGCGTEQDKASIRHFQQFLSQACTTIGATISDTTLSALAGIDARPTLMMFDYCAGEIRPEDKTAIAQFGLHLTDAYFGYCDSTNEPTKA
jgi:hypothetical protein